MKTNSFECPKTIKQGRNWLSKSGGASSNMGAMATRRRCRRRLLFCQKMGGGGQLPLYLPYSYAPVKNYEKKKYLERQMLGRQFICPISPANLGGGREEGIVNQM